jgi:hypothetical protein
VSGKNDHSLNEAAFAKAAKTFHRLRGSEVACLRAAISVYRAEEMFQNTSAFSNLVFAAADSDKGENTALVISGFADIAHIEAFISGIHHV